jgi:hypothetical protein
MQALANFEICFECKTAFPKQTLYKDWDSYYAGLFNADKENKNMYALSQLIQRDSLWRCRTCRPFVSSNLIGKKLEKIDEREVFTDFNEQEKNDQKELDEMYD